MADIFISYRREDSIYITGRIYDKLKQHFGPDAIFMDVEGKIPLGANFKDHLTEHVQSCKVQLVIIGSSWLKVTDDAGRRRLDNPLDWVRIEVEAALQRDIPVVPVVLGGATLPLESQLPDSMAELAARQAITIRADPDFDSDVRRLAKGLEQYVQPQKTNVSTTAPTAPGPMPPSVQTLVVHPMAGRGDFTTISAAIEAADEGAKILVKPGLYHEGIVIDKPVEIAGDGSVDDIVIESADGGCIRIATDYAEVRGFTLRCIAGKQGKKVSGIFINRGRLVLENCDVSSDSLSCVEIGGETANPVLRKCRIHDGKQAGVHIRDGGAGLVEDCDIYGNRLSNITIRSGGHPAIRNCRIHSGKENGVMIYEEGKGLVEDCEIYGNNYHGVQIKEKGNPTIQHCAIHTNANYGIRANLSGAGVVEDCEIRDNGSGSWLTDETTTTISRNNIED